MAAFKKSDALDTLIGELEADGLQDVLYDGSDGNCTPGYDNDGSTGSEIFENGFELALKAAGRDVYAAEQDGVTFFFIGTEEEILQKLSALGEEG
jgi:hypothetical protein